MNYGSGWWPIFNHVKEADLRKWAGHQRGSERELEKETLGSIQVLCSISPEGQLRPSLSLLFQRFTFFATASWSPNCSAKSEGSSRASKRAVSKGEVIKAELHKQIRSQGVEAGDTHWFGGDQSNWIVIDWSCFRAHFLGCWWWWVFFLLFILFCFATYVSYGLPRWHSGKEFTC